MANIQDGQQNDSLSKMASKGPFYLNWNFELFQVF